MIAKVIRKPRNGRIDKKTLINLLPKPPYRSGRPRMKSSAEQQLRDAMEAMGHPQAQTWSAGDCGAAALGAMAATEPGTAIITQADRERASSACNAAWGAKKTPGGTCKCGDVWLYSFETVAKFNGTKHTTEACVSLNIVTTEEVAAAAKQTGLCANGRWIVHPDALLDFAVALMEVRNGQ